MFALRRLLPPSCRYPGATETDSQWCGGGHSAPATIALAPHLHGQADTDKRESKLKGAGEEAIPGEGDDAWATHPVPPACALFDPKA